MGVVPDNKGQESANFFPNYLISPNDANPSYYLTKDDIVKGQYDVIIR